MYRCRGEDSNPHVRKGHGALNAARLPVPPPRLPFIIPVRQTQGKQKAPHMRGFLFGGLSSLSALKTVPPFGFAASEGVFSTALRLWRTVPPSTLRFQETQCPTLPFGSAGRNPEVCCHRGDAKPQDLIHTISYYYMNVKPPPCSTGDFVKLLHFREELFDTEGPTTQRIWSIFAHYLRKCYISLVKIVFAQSLADCVHCF